MFISSRSARSLVTMVGLALPLVGLTVPVWADPADKPAPAPQGPPGMRQLTPEEVEKLQLRKKNEQALWAPLPKAYTLFLK